MRNVAVALIVWAALHGMGGAIQASELVTNGGFETGTFAGWTRLGGLSSSGITSGSHSGSFAAYFGEVGSLSFISQDLATSPSGRYNLTFWVRGSARPNELTVWWDGGQLVDHRNVYYRDWTQYTFDVTASTGSTALKLGFRNDPAVLLLDDVSVTSAVPVPSTLAGLSSMLAVGAVVMWRKRKQAA